MSATQTVTTTTREWKQKKNDTKKVGTSVAQAYKSQLKKARASAKPKQAKQRRCPTCGRPL